MNHFNCSISSVLNLFELNDYFTLVEYQEYIY